jgi:hypothetical protein
MLNYIIYKKSFTEENKNITLMFKMTRRMIENFKNSIQLH